MGSALTDVNAVIGRMNDDKYIEKTIRKCGPHKVTKHSPHILYMDICIVGEPLVPLSLCFCPLLFRSLFVSPVFSLPHSIALSLDRLRFVTHTRTTLTRRDTMPTSPLMKRTKLMLWGDL